jgi:hypothetical protein
MGTNAGPIVIDPVAEANALANLFYSLSQALDNFRLGDFNPPLSGDNAASLKAEAQALDDRAHEFTAQAIGATLQTIQADLAKIKDVTNQAIHQLGVLNDVSKVISIATSALSLGTAIVSGDPLAIVGAVDGLAEAVDG